VRSPSFEGLRPASQASSRAKQANHAVGTTHEKELRHHLWINGLRYRKNVSKLPGKPDVVFPMARMVIFCDGDFWHGRNWESLKKKLRRGSNPDYWIAKIRANMQRDLVNTRKLKQAGWKVVRVWEGDIRLHAARIALRLKGLVETRLIGMPKD